MIRLYQPDVKTELIKLLELNTPRYFAPAEAADFSDYLENHLEEYFVVQEEENIVGCGGINYFPEEKVARLSWDIIHPRYQGKGFGTELTQYRIKVIEAYPEIETILVRTTQLVYPFYERLGFVLEKTETDFWAPGIDLCQMKIQLPHPRNHQGVGSINNSFP